jgi:hypothetical protein
MFERIADELLPATESIGIEESRLTRIRPESAGETRCYVPIVVTNATLYAASFDLSAFDMKSGRLPAGTCDFQEVPCVRFRKSLGTHLTMRQEVEPQGIRDATAEANWASQRTILVMNSASLGSSLRDLRISQRHPAEFGMAMERLYLHAWDRADNA